MKVAPMHDVIVTGARVAGASTAMLLARQAHAGMDVPTARPRFFAQRLSYRGGHNLALSSFQLT
jgi:hypothetical protein